jgi:hypothetical protein
MEIGTGTPDVSSSIEPRTEPEAQPARRELLRTLAVGGGALAAASLLRPEPLRSQTLDRTRPQRFDPPQQATTVRCAHGWNPDTLRPADAQTVYWQGAVPPRNARSGDLWYDTKIPTIKTGVILELDAGDLNSYTGTGSAWLDLSGRGNHGALSGGVSFSEEASGSLAFDGSSGLVDLPNDLGYTSEFSAFAWFRATGAPAGGFHIIFGGQELEISIPTAGQIRTGVLTSSRHVSNHGSGLTDGAWHQVGFTFSAGVKTSYIDGASVGTQNVAGTLVSQFSSRRMGRWGSNTLYYLNGKIASAVIYNRALTAGEVEHNFEVTRERFGL